MSDFFPYHQPINLQTKILGIITSVVILYLIIKLISSGKLKTGYALLWFSLSAIIFLFSTFDFLFFGIAEIMGIFYAPAMLFSLLIVNILAINIHYSLVLTKMEKQMTKIAQEIAFLQKKTEKK